jgi:chemotaxis protein CheD
MSSPPAPLPSQTIGWHASSSPVISLLPGELYFGQRHLLKTLLGSCVAITLWHPQRQFGGMCHYLLPHRTRRPEEKLDGRYGDEAVTTLVSALERAGTKSSDYICHLYGGADTLSGATQTKFNVGERNIEQAWTLIDRYGFQIDGIDVGDDVPRHVSIDLRTGLVDVRRGPSVKAVPRAN